MMCTKKNCRLEGFSLPPVDRKGSRPPTLSMEKCFVKVADCVFFQAEEHPYYRWMSHDILQIVSSFRLKSLSWCQWRRRLWPSRRTSLGGSQTAPWSWSTSRWGTDSSTQITRWENIEDGRQSRSAASLHTQTVKCTAVDTDSNSKQQRGWRHRWVLFRWRPLVWNRPGYCTDNTGVFFLLFLFLGAPLFIPSVLLAAMTTPSKPSTPSGNSQPTRNTNRPVIRLVPAKTLWQVCMYYLCKYVVGAFLGHVTRAVPRAACFFGFLIPHHIILIPTRRWSDRFDESTK